FAQDGKLIGMITAADTIKEDSFDAITKLKKLGMQVVMLTGDNERTASAIAKVAGVDRVVAGVKPDGKEAVISELQKQGKVAMVGDGINDAPALTKADIGIAIGAGTDVAIDSADIVLSNSTLTDVVRAVRLSRATLHNVKENLFWAFFYNLICIPLAAGLFGLSMNPMFGAAAMALSSVTVCMNALRLNLFKIDKDIEEKHIQREKHTERKEEKQMEKKIMIEGMVCGHCEKAVKNALEKIDGVTSAEVSHVSKQAIVTLNKEVSNEELRKAVEAEDYTVTGIE
ncbi:MAG: HAD-IC family P-type ATPase, partial [Solobacterium sp.]|nr:HAD-IC family P-type ATPase [Solobacterium sp.]